MLTITEETRVFLRDLLYKPQMQLAKDEMLRRCPSVMVGDLSALKIEATALQAAKAEGYREAIRTFFEILPFESTPQGDTPFIETSKD